MAWNGYWEKHSQAWIQSINNLNTTPDEIIIVSDKEIDTSQITITDKIKNLVVSVDSGRTTLSHYRNVAIENASFDWLVASDIDDKPFCNYLDDLDPDADIHAFSFVDGNQTYYPNKNSLLYRLKNKNNEHLIPGTSAIKKDLFKKIRYENCCHEDQTFYSTAYAIGAHLGFDKNIRFEYSGWSANESTEKRRVTNIYISMIGGTDRSLYVCWFSKDMSENRSAALKILEKKSRVNLKLITDNNFYQYNHPEIPIHPAFKYLSDVHKSDYARSYLMYFYGGGYSDVKANGFDWNPYFDKLFSSKHDAIGYAEKHIQAVAPFWENDSAIKYNDVESQYNKFAGNGHYIFKPKTVFAKEWLLRLHNLLDLKLESLSRHPGTYHPYAITGGIHQSYNGEYSGEFDGSLYPITWNEINGRIRQKIEYENKFSNFMLGMPHPNMENYR